MFKTRFIIFRNLNTRVVIIKKKKENYVENTRRDHDNLYFENRFEFIKHSMIVFKLIF